MYRRTYRRNDWTTIALGLKQKESKHGWGKRMKKAARQNYRYTYSRLLLLDRQKAN